jgi:hypothetical protein
MPPRPGYGAPPGMGGAVGAAVAAANKKATNAMIWAICGICCGIAAIIGIVLGVQANKDGADNGHGTIAIVVGAILLALNVFGAIARLTFMSHGGLR